MKKWIDHGLLTHLVVSTFVVCVLLGQSAWSSEHPTCKNEISLEALRSAVSSFCCELQLDGEPPSFEHPHVSNIIAKYNNVDNVTCSALVSLSIWHRFLTSYRVQRMPNGRLSTTVYNPLFGGQGK